jgi:hypothetical protein
VSGSIETKSSPYVQELSIEEGNNEEQRGVKESIPPYSSVTGANEDVNLRDSVRQASLAIRFEDVVERIERLTTRVIEYANRGEGWNPLAEEMDKCYCELQAWLYDVSVREVSAEGTMVDISAYDVLEILSMGSTAIDSEIPQKVSQKLHELEQFISELGNRLSEQGWTTPATE